LARKRILASSEIRVLYVSQHQKGNPENDSGKLRKENK
tara:strand:- start:341 stop:454 length:114 start_codon:yes stop_codon:yes gene_type:complete